MLGLAEAQDVNGEKDLPLSKPSGEELLSGQLWMVVEHISQHLCEEGRERSEQGERKEEGGRRRREGRGGREEEGGGGGRRREGRETLDQGRSE